MSSDSSDEENLELLREATDTQFLNDALYKNAGKNSTNNETIQTKIDTPKSLRPSREEDDQFRLLDITPGFRNHMAKRLSSYLDSKLKNVFVTLNNSEEIVNRDTKSGIKLFKTSKRCISELDLNESTSFKKKKIVQILNNVSEKDMYEKVKEAAVTPEQVLSGEETKHWTSKKKAIVYKYKKLKDGTLISLDDKV